MTMQNEYHIYTVLINRLLIEITISNISSFENNVPKKLYYYKHIYNFPMLFAHFLCAALTYQCGQVQGGQHILSDLLSYRNDKLCSYHHFQAGDKTLHQSHEEDLKIN